MKFRPCVQTDRQTDVTKLIVAFRYLTHPIKSHFCPFLPNTVSVNNTIGNFVENRLFGVALNQADSKQRNKIFIICFESPIMETELNIEKKWFKREGKPYIVIAQFLVLYY